MSNEPSTPTPAEPTKERHQLKKYSSLGVSLLTVLVALAMMAGPADARVHRHHRHHRRGGGGGIVCGPGTVNVGGVCTPTTPPGPTSNFQVVPGTIQMAVASATTGKFSASVMGTGLPQGSYTVTAGGAACPITVTGSPATADIFGRIFVTLSATACHPGTYPVQASQAAAPFQTFLSNITLTF